MFPKNTRNRDVSGKLPDFAALSCLMEYITNGVKPSPIDTLPKDDMSRSSELRCCFSVLVWHGD